MNIEEINESQWESLKSIRLESLLDSPDAFCISYEEANNLTDKEWKLLAAGKLGSQFLIAYDYKNAIGLVGILDKKETYEIVSMWVKPAAREQGVGKALIKTLLDHALSVGHTEVRLQVTSNNTSARCFYKKLGFVELAQTNEVKRKSDEGMIEMTWCYDNKVTQIKQLNSIE
ncbi:GNAT family N-acetyltransferase [Pleionea mediterranea]|uniref:Ribosomal protein S18 acetylase RimI-like enzyme n=1 Tax=Pleionea mediterranea TaxID=523701 RepID=A0A316FN54_9GAMM|nr:GNAT family N-acetyltransferase [Pleionea mediterranea]PWK49096.1 ribosomal protein S18 acetylase RimI-like enzyme [Pleionea mediterranea]